MIIWGSPVSLIMPTWIGGAGGGEGGRTEEMVFCVDYHYAVAFYR